MTLLVVIGGSDAGISAAVRARECAPEQDVTVLVADSFPNYSICGLPFYLSGEVSDHRLLAHRTIGELEGLGIHLRLDHRAVQIEPEENRVLAMTGGGSPCSFKYDRLVVATGASSSRPPTEGLELPGVFSLRWMSDAFALRDYLAENQPLSAVLVGSGYVGVEMADALTRRGMSVTMVARSAVLKTVDGTLALLVRDELTNHGVKIVDATFAGVERRSPGKLAAATADGRSLDGDLVLVATGSRPNSQLAEGAGASLGPHGAVRVSRAMETSVPDIYAAGDCAETWHRLLRTNVYLPLGTTAHKQGLVAGENAAGGEATFAESIGTQVVKVFDLVVGRTGLLHREAFEAGFAPRTTEVESFDHKVYYPGATSLWVRLTADQPTGVLLGGQVLGRYSAEVSKRLDVIAAAVSEGLTVQGLADLDLSYTPPTSSPWDPLQQCAQKWLEG